MPTATLPLTQRPKMTRAMYQKLKAHIMKQRERRKQAEDQEAANERIRKENEIRKQLQESLSIDQLKKELTQVEARLKELEEAKKKVFAELKTALNEKTNRKVEATVDSSMGTSATAAAAATAAVATISNWPSSTGMTISSVPVGLTATSAPALSTSLLRKPGRPARAIQPAGHVQPQTRQLSTGGFKAGHLTQQQTPLYQGTNLNGPTSAKRLKPM